MTDNRYTEAEAWHLRLRDPVIDQATLIELRNWRAEPDNDRAFRTVQRDWRLSRGTASLSRGITRRPKVLAARKGGPAFAAVLVCAFVVIAATRLWSGGTLYVTRPGQQSVVRLADGSTLRLDTNSRARVRLAPSRRNVRLESGQALFEVARDPTRPFVVEAGDASVTALGTAFNVRKFSTSRVQVALLRGKVEVRQLDQGATQDWVLTPGQGLTTGRPHVVPAPLVAAEVTSWTEGRLVFHNTPVAQAVAETNRYALAPLSLIADPARLAMTVDGTFVAGDTDALARALSALYDLNITRERNGAIFLRPRVEGTASPTPR